VEDLVGKNWGKVRVTSPVMRGNPERYGTEFALTFPAVPCPKGAS
jgi:hypothetical protein